MRSRQLQCPVLLGYNRHFGTLENYWMADYMRSPAAARYDDAFFMNINWGTVLARMEALG